MMSTTSFRSLAVAIPTMLSLIVALNASSAPQTSADNTDGEMEEGPCNATGESSLRTYFMSQCINHENNLTYSTSLLGILVQTCELYLVHDGDTASENTYAGKCVIVSGNNSEPLGRKTRNLNASDDGETEAQQGGESLQEAADKFDPCHPNTTVDSMRTALLAYCSVWHIGNDGHEKALRMIVELPDANGDGIITQAEAERLNNYSKEKLGEEIMHMLAKNSTHILGDDLCTGKSNEQDVFSEWPTHLKEILYKRADSDGNGAVSSKEACTVMQSV